MFADLSKKIWTVEDFLRETRKYVPEIFPWELLELLQKKSEDRESVSSVPIILDVREPAEYEAMHIADSKNIPRGVLESSCAEGYQESDPDLIASRGREIVVVCRSGNRSLLAARTMQLMGYQNVKSMKTGVRGWADDEFPLEDVERKAVTAEQSEAFFYPS